MINSMLLNSVHRHQHESSKWLREPYNLGKSYGKKIRGTKGCITEVKCRFSRTQKEGEGRVEGRGVQGDHERGGFQR